MLFKGFKHVKELFLSDFVHLEVFRNFMKIELRNYNREILAESDIDMIG